MWRSAKLSRNFARVFCRLCPQVEEAFSTKFRPNRWFITGSKLLSKRQMWTGVTVGFAIPSFFGFGKKEEDGEDPVVMSMKRAKLCQMREDLVGAEKHYHNALSETNRKKRANELTDKQFLYAIVNITDSLAELSLLQGNLESSATLYKEVMKGCLQLGLPTNDNAIIEISVKLASIFAMQNKIEDARQGYIHCIEEQEKKMKALENPDENTRALFGLAMDSYSRFLLVQREYESAEKYLLKSYNLACEVLGPEHPQSLVVLNSLATVHILRRNYDKAEKSVKEAIDIGERIKSSDLAAFHCNLGAIHLRKGLYEDAAKTCALAKKLATKNKDKVSKSQAEKCLEKVREIQSKKA